MNTEKIWYSHAPQKSPGIDTERTHSSNFFMSVSSSQGLTSNRTDDLPPGQPSNTSVPSSKFKTAQVSSKSQQIDHAIQMWQFTNLKKTALHPWIQKRLHEPWMHLKYNAIAIHSNPASQDENEQEKKLTLLLLGPCSLLGCFMLSCRCCFLLCLISKQIKIIITFLHIRPIETVSS